ncbi:MAG: hypothetical protein ACT4OU_10550 [Hyphomicrobium sp.]
MKLKSLLAAAALLTAPALLAGPATAADWDGRRGDRGYSESRYDRDDYDRPRHHYRRNWRRGPWWAYDRPWNWRRHRYVNRWDHDHDRPRYPRRDW